MKRHELSPDHPVLGGWLKLGDQDTLLPGDETACVSQLLAIDSSTKWEPIKPEWSDCIGFLIGDICDNMGDADGHERVFRRKVL